jgi:hypothetical protein
MTRRLLSPGSMCLMSCLLASLPALPARADDLPMRKPGLWEMKIARIGSVLPAMTTQHCTDESHEKDMSTSFLPLSKETCAKRDIQKTATGYVADYGCAVGGVKIVSHADITGDFNSAFTVKSTTHSERGDSGPKYDNATTIEAKWLGACKPDQKPGDIVMPGGFKLNVKDAEKLKSLIPK